jgi:hypothetical protein
VDSFLVTSSDDRINLLPGENVMVPTGTGMNVHLWVCVAEELPWTRAPTQPELRILVLWFEGSHPSST